MKNVDFRAAMFKFSDTPNSTLLSSLKNIIYLFIFGLE